MSKRQLIDEILTINLSAEPAFLAEFEPGDLRDYLTKLLRYAGARAGATRPTRPRHAADQQDQATQTATATPPEGDPAPDAEAEQETTCPLFEAVA